MTESESEAQQQISQWLQEDPFRMQVLRAVQALNLPQGFVAAGFLRNLVWDRLHQKSFSELNDIDIIYFDTEHSEDEKRALLLLQQQLPQISWDVKNQARMHVKHHHQPYSGCAEAMANWPEKETAIGVRLNQQQQLEFIAPWGLSFLFELKISWNQARPLGLFQQRVNEKRWLSRWPRLSLAIAENDND